MENFPGFTTLGIVDEVQKMMTELRCKPEHFQGRIISMSMCNDIYCGKQGNRKLSMLEDSCEDIGRFWCLDPRRNGFSKNIEKGQFFIAFGDDTLDTLMGSYREKTLLRSAESTHERWIRGTRRSVQSWR